MVMQYRRIVPTKTLNQNRLLECWILALYSQNFYLQKLVLKLLSPALNSSPQPSVESGWSTSLGLEVQELFNEWSRSKVCSQQVVVFVKWRQLVCTQDDRDFEGTLYVHG